MDPTPRYDHDCQECRFLGGYVWLANRFDLYVCGQHVFQYPTLIARWGSEGPDYTSSLAQAVREYVHDVSHPLAQALLLAVARAAEVK